jgi:chorismate mutase
MCGRSARDTTDKETAMTLNDHRRRIDELDRELVRLLNRRAQMSIQLGQLKKDTGLPMRDEAREVAILRYVQRANPGPLDDQALGAIFAAILAESRRVTGNMLAEAVKVAV